MFARVFSGGLAGVEAYCIEVECDCYGGIGQIHMVGLPDAAVKESQERVRSAIKACDFLMPYAKKWVVNLAPADMRKEGPAYDLPIAVGILAATGMVRTAHISKFWLIGELGLDGSVRPVSGVLPIALAARKHGAYGIVLPEANADEASLVEGLKIFPVSHLKQVCMLINDPEKGEYLEPNPRSDFLRRLHVRQFDIDFNEVKGQDRAKRALTIAAAGRHNVLMIGPPGSGKSMLAQRLPTIMPPLGFEEALELTKLYSVAGMLAKRGALLLERPFRSPHHSASSVGLVGGGNYPKPGEISLSHMGILFLDELTEFPRAHLENLRQPLESQNVTISRANQTLTYPASFIFVGACNPCPCGYRGDLGGKNCTCLGTQAERYWSRLSGPLLDRIDMQVLVKQLSQEELQKDRVELSSEEIRLQVLRAVERQRERFGNMPFAYNAQMSRRAINKYCQISEKSRWVLAQSISAKYGTARAFDRVLRVARTIADLADRDQIVDEDVQEAVNFRHPDIKL